MPTISVKDFWFGPVPFNFYLGGVRQYNCNLQFSDTPPDTFSYTVNIRDINGNIVKTFTETDVPTEDGLGVIELEWDGSLDSSGDKATSGASSAFATFGSYFFKVAATALGYDEMTETRTCSGGNTQDCKSGNCPPSDTRING